MDKEPDFERHKKTSKKVIKLLLVIIIVPLVLRFQVNRPKSSIVYYTSDPDDNIRHGNTFTCGCVLPTFMQGPQNPNNYSGSDPGGLDHNSSLNVCLDSSSLETVNVLMYSNFSHVESLEQILESGYGGDFKEKKEERIVEGFHESQEAHDFSWTNNTFLENLSAIYIAGTPIQRQLKVSIDYLQNKPNNAPFTDFPASYINLALAFKCTNCSKCPLQMVNQIFADISGNTDETWGACAYWESGNQCGNAEENSYVAKCAMYPTKAMPLNFAISTFLQNLTEVIAPSGYIWAPENSSTVNYSSFGANVLHMDFSKATRGPIQLSFLELPQYSPAWLDIRDVFPTMGVECSHLVPATVSNGTSICNVFSDGTKAVNLTCLQMTSNSECDRYIPKNDPFNNVTVDADENLWAKFNVPKGNWTDLMCLHYENQSVPPYMVLSERVPPAGQNCSLNAFLKQNEPSYLWAQDSGVCMNTFSDVVRQNISQNVLEGNGEENKLVTVYMQTNCSRKGGYCWYTGRYQNLTDIPQPSSQQYNMSFWHNMSSFSNPPDLFVCYLVQDQNFWIWLVVTFGVLFGWLGTADLLCTWVIFPFSRWIWRKLEFRRLKKESDMMSSSKVTDVNAEAQSIRIGAAPTASEDAGGVVIVKHDYRKSWSDIAALRARLQDLHPMHIGRQRGPIMELEELAPLGHTGARSDSGISGD